MEISFFNRIGVNCPAVSFLGKTEDFWSDYKKSHRDTPLRTTILRTIRSDENLLGEGFNKKGYILSGNDDYVVRVYKHCFEPSDLERRFEKPQKSFIDSVDGVVLTIPGKIDIVKRKFGKTLGVEHYAQKVAPPLDNIPVSREETLEALKTYEALQNFPISSFVAAYRQIRDFSGKKGYQFDIISPNNILIDTERKKINLIDPMDPVLNKCEKGNLVDFSKFHGADSLYPVLCDFLMQKEHLRNLTPNEQIRWKKAINNIVLKSIIGGQRAGYQRSADRLEFLYKRIDSIWNMNNGVSDRYREFMELYSGAVNQDELINVAIDYKNGVAARRKAIQKLSPLDIKELKPAFEKIFEAPHQPKVEVPEILNVVIEKMAEYGKDAKSVLPTIYPLFSKELFYPTKRRIYDLFISINPADKIFLAEMKKSADNPFERTLYKKQFIDLYKASNLLSAQKRSEIKKICKTALESPGLPKDFVAKLWISRTCVSSGPKQDAAIENMKIAYDCIESKKNSLPAIKDLIELHKISMDDIPGEEQFAGVVRTPKNEYMFWQNLPVKKDAKKTVNPYLDSKDIPLALKKLELYIKENHDKVDTFDLASEIFSAIVKIHPFFNGNGRAARLFTEQFLLAKGYRLMAWPEETLYRNICSQQEMAVKLRECSQKA